MTHDAGSPSPGYASPEEAALRGFPSSAGCRVVASRAHDSVGYVLLDTGPVEHPYQYGVNCIREAGGWREGNSSNGPGWSLIDGDADLGTLTLWDDAPRGADRVRAVFSGQVVEVPVEHGVYLAVWWNVPNEHFEPPRLEAFRIGGTWVPPARSGKRPA